MDLKNTFNEYFKYRSDKKIISLKNNLSSLYNTSSHLINNKIESQKIVNKYITTLKKIANMSIFIKDLSSITKNYNNIFN